MLTTGGEELGAGGSCVNMGSVNCISGEGIFATTDIVVVVYRCDETWRGVGVVVNFFLRRVLVRLIG